MQDEVSELAFTEFLGNSTPIAINDDAYHQIFEDNLAIKLLVDPDTNLIKDANNAAVTFYGYVLSELKQMRYTELAAANHAISTQSYLQKPEQHQIFFTRHRNASGEVRDVEVFAGPLEIEGKLFTYLIILDVTEHQRIEETLQQSISLLKTIFDNTEDAIFIKDLDGTYLFINPAGENFLGKAESEIIGKNDFVLLTPDVANRSLQADRELFAFGGTKSYEDTLLLGSITRTFFITKSVYRDAEGRIIGLIGIARDITARKRAEIELKESELHFRTLAKMAPVGIFRIDHLGNCVYVNERWCEISGVSAEQAKKRGWLHSVHQEDISSVSIEWDRATTENSPLRVEYRTRRVGNNPTWVLTTAVAELNINGEINGYIGTVTDITEVRQAEQRIRHLAHFDALTNLPNRNLLLDRLGQAMAKARRNNGMLALLFIDLDRFKIINDTLGHATGDLLLQAVAERLNRCVREADTVSRQGGDEFVVVLPDLNHTKDAAQVAQKFLQALAGPFMIANHEMHITPSIGIALFPNDGTDADTLMKNADSAMYRVKEQGKNHYQFYTADMNSSALQRLDLENSLRKAVEREEFLLFYQPQIDLATGRISSIEAHLYWQHPENGLLPWQEFANLAEETGQILPIGEWLLRTACKQNKSWQEAGLPPVRVVTNLSAQQFQHRDMVEMVRRVLHETQLESRYLEIEITEAILMRNTLQMIETLKALKAMGIYLSIDDFGIGYSSLSYLKRFPIDRLKIDRSFVQDISGDNDDIAIVEAVIALGHSLRLKVVAEGVETVEQLMFLQSRRCDEAQGYYFSYPLAPEEATRVFHETWLTPGQGYLPLLEST